MPVKKATTKKAAEKKPRVTKAKVETKTTTRRKKPAKAEGKEESSAAAEALRGDGAGEIGGQTPDRGRAGVAAAVAPAAEREGSG